MSALAVVIESRLTDLVAKGVLASPRAIFDPGGVFDRIVILTPYDDDLELSETMAANGVDLVCHGGRARKPWTLPFVVLRIARAINEREVSVLRGSNAFLGSLLGAFAARLAGCASVVWLGGDNRIAQSAQGCWYYKSRRLTNIIEWMTLRFVDAVLVPNRFTADYVSRIAGQRVRRKITIIPWPAGRVPEQELDEPDLSVLGLLPTDIVVPVIGFVNRYKFSDVVFDALEQGPILAPEGPVRFVFCGDGDLRPEGERRFANRGDVIFTGFRQQDVVRALIRRARVVCIPMSGMVLIEAASLGRPVVSSRIEWHSEIIEHDVTGLLVEPTDPNAWRDAISRLLGDPQTSAHMAERLRARYESQYAAEVIAVRMREYFQTLAEESHKL